MSNGSGESIFQGASMLRMMNGFLGYYVFLKGTKVSISVSSNLELMRDTQVDLNCT